MTLSLMPDWTGILDTKRLQYTYNKNYSLIEKTTIMFVINL